MNEIAITPEHDGRRAFNASICDFEGFLWMAYRVSHHDRPDRLWIARLNRQTLRPVWSLPLEVPLAEGWGAEDPRLFVHADRLHVAWTAADYQRKPWRATMFYGAISFKTDTLCVNRAYQPRYGFNQIDQREKNWQFFSLGGCLFAQYGPSPHRVIQIDRDKVIGEWKTDGFAWGHGRPSGGTPPIKTDRGTLLTFFHAYTPHPTRERQYNFGAMEFSPVTPFEIRRVSPRPILTASDEWPTTSDEWSPLCVFPGGAIDAGGGRCLVAAGINDACIRLFEIDADDMPMVEPEFIPVEETGYFRTLQSFLLGGRVRTVGEVVETDIETAHKLLTRNWIQPYENQIA